MRREGPRGVGAPPRGAPGGPRIAKAAAARSPDSRQARIRRPAKPAGRKTPDSRRARFRVPGCRPPRKLPARSRRLRWVAPGGAAFPTDSPAGAHTSLGRPLRCSAARAGRAAVEGGGAFDGKPRVTKRTSDRARKGAGVALEAAGAHEIKNSEPGGLGCQVQCLVIGLRHSDGQFCRVTLGFMFDTTKFRPASAEPPCYGSRRLEAGA